MIACRATDLCNREKKRRGKAGEQMGPPAYSFSESYEPIVGISSPHELDTRKSHSSLHELDTRKSHSSKGDCTWVSEASSGQDHDCAAELGCGRKHSLADECDSVKEVTVV